MKIRTVNQKPPQVAIDLFRTFTAGIPQDNNTKRFIISRVGTVRDCDIKGGNLLDNAVLTSRYIKLFSQERFNIRLTRQTG